jgi:hypothetical protein
MKGEEKELLRLEEELQSRACVIFDPEVPQERTCPHQARTELVNPGLPRSISGAKR